MLPSSKELGDISRKRRGSNGRDHSVPDSGFCFVFFSTIPLYIIKTKGKVTLKKEGHEVLGHHGEVIAASDFQVWA